MLRPHRLATLLLATLGLVAGAAADTTTRTLDGRTPDGRTPDGRTPEGRTPEQRRAVNRAVNAEVAAARRVAPALGVHVVEVGSGEEVYSFHADEPRIVASNTKLMTTAAALDRLGPGFFFETEVVARGAVEGGVLEGEVAVVGGGDPNLSGRHYFGDPYGPFREWAAALRARGVRQVAGDLVLVDGLFDDQLVHPDWPRDQLTRWYEAPVAALSYNDNCVLVKVSPAGGSPNGAVGRPAVVETVPPIELFEVESTASTTGNPGRQWLRIDREEAGGSEHVLTVAGRIYRGTEIFDKWVAVADPVGYFGAALEDALAEEGIEVEGAVRRVDALPGVGWWPVTTHRTDLLTTLEVINERSQNFYAESVLKLLGARLCGEGSWGAGLRVVAEFLAEAGIEPESYRMADGSGMSRNNRFTPRQLTRLLRHMFTHRWGPEWIRTLPYSGQRDLRWEKRLADPPYRGNVIAKTGSLNGVSTLSGYAKGRSGTLYAFSLLMNRTTANYRAKKAQDEILRALVDHG